MRRRRLGSVSSWCLALAVTLFAAAASGAPDPEKLFAEGSALIAQGRCAEALPMLEESQRLDPGIGTLFNVAVCQQELGRLGSAWRSFERVRDLARASGKKQREEAARAKLGELESRVPALVIRVGSGAGADVTVKVDGVIVPREGWSFVAVDPGTHTVEASAPSKRPWQSTFSAPAERARVEVVVPELETAEQIRVVTVETSNTKRTVGLIVGGVGVVGAITAAVTGVMLLDAKSTADDRCKPRCVDANGAFDQRGADAVSRGETLLPINAVAWGVGAVGLGVGLFLVLTSPSSARASANAVPRLELTPTPGGSSLRVTF